MRRAFTRFGTLIDCRFQVQKNHELITVHPLAGRRSALIDRVPVTARRSGLDPAQWLEGRAPENPDGDDGGPARVAAEQPEARDGVTMPVRDRRSRTGDLLIAADDGNHVLHRTLTLEHGDTGDLFLPVMGLIRE